jgi:hypothetical protein
LAFYGFIKNKEKMFQEVYMEGYQFFDFFATKDIDYLLAIISLLLLIPFWKMLSVGRRQTPKKRKKTSVV